MENETYQKFVSLVCRLSPENLTCDGECSRAEVNRRHAQIMREWGILEREEAKRKVSQNEIEVMMIAEYQKR